MFNKITDVDREDMVQQFTGALDVGSTQDVLDGLRIQLRAKYCPHLYRDRQVDAVCSQVIIQRNRTKKKMEIVITETSDIKSNDDIKKDEPQKKFTRVRVHPKSGAWTDYEESEVKEVWRQNELLFFDRNIEFFDKKPEDMKVLCTPGIKCHLEIQRFIDRGIKPSNIIAVERVKAAWADFEVNCHQMGIEPRYGDLKDVLRETNTPFDILLVDFVGQYCLSAEQILQQVPLAEKAMISVNMQGKRESKKSQRNMLRAIFQNTEKTYQEMSVVSEEMRRGLARGKKFQTIMRDILEREKEFLDTEEPEASDDGRDAILHSLIKHAGIAHRLNWTMPNFIANFPVIFDGQANSTDPFMKSRSFHQSLEDLERNIAAPMLVPQLGKRIPADELLLIAYISSLGLDAILGAPYIAKLEKYKYMSRVGRTPSPYFTNLAIIERPLDIYKRLRMSASFVGAGARMCANDLTTGFTGGVRTGEGKMSWIFEKDGKNQVAAGTAIQSFLSDLRIFSSLYEKYPLSKYENTQNTPRIMLDS